MRDVLNNIKKEVDKLADEGYVAPGVILDTLKPIRTGYVERLSIDILPKMIKTEPQTITMVKDHGRKQALEMIDLYYELKTEPQKCSVNGRPYSECSLCEYFRCTADDLQEDLIKRSDAVDAIENVDWYHQNRNKDMVSGANSDEHQAWYKADDIYEALEAVPSINRKE